VDHLIKFFNKKYVGRFGIGGKERTDLRVRQLSGPEIEYKSNRFGFRSKELKKFDPNNINIIYSGCSNTWGEGVFEKDIWGNILADKIKTIHQNKHIDNNNIAYSGANIKSIIKNILSVIEITENPNYLFVCFPSVSRDLHYSDKHKTFINCFVNDFYLLDPVDVQIKYNKNFSQENNFLTSTTMIFLLESFCKHANIKFYWTTWDEKDDKIFQKINFNNYIKIDNKYELEAKNTNSPYWEIAKDNLHPGAKWHLGVANNIFFNLKK
jgi:hypothetical protein